jgi:RNA polymerase sigma-70 factor (ECF subfamily)
MEKENKIDILTCLEEVKSGNTKFHKQIYDSQKKVALYEAIRLFGGDIDKAEELTSRVMIKLFYSLDKFSSKKSNSSLGGWTRKITRNMFLDLKRKKDYIIRSSMVRIDDSFDLGDNEVQTIQIKEKSLNVEESIISNELDSESIRRLKKAVSKLNKEEQQIIFLRFNSNLSFEEIAEETGLTLTNCLTKFHRLKKKLKKLM